MLMVFRREEKDNFARGRAQTDRTGWVGWLVSIGLHLGLVVVFLLVSVSGTVSNPDSKPPPQTSFQHIVEPLQVEELKTANLNPLKMDKAKPVETKLPQLTGDTSPGVLGDAIAIAADSGVGGGGSMGRTIPASANRVQFCGAAGKGIRLCYVVDCSGSMIIAFDYIKAQLQSSIVKLKPTQYFNIILFAGGEPVEYAPGKLVRASARQRKKAAAFILNIDLSRVSNAVNAEKSLLAAMQAAFNARDHNGKQVQQIFLLTDGEFDQASIDYAISVLQSQASNPVTVSVVACGNSDNAAFLRRLAQKNHGAYRFVSDNELARAGLHP